MEVLDLVYRALMDAAFDSWPVLTALALGILIPWIYMLLRPPPPRRCGTRNGPPITAPRIRLRDGRYLAYKEAGVPKEQAKYKAVYAHPFSGSRSSLDAFSQELLEGLSVYMVAYDRAGYGESDPFPERSVKSESEDIEQLADKLELGEKFYVVALSMGGYPAWSCLKYIPQRLAGVAMMAPAVNFWWPGVEAEVSKQALAAQGVGDRIGFSIAHYVPWVLHLWSKQKLVSSAVCRRFDESRMNKLDADIAAGWRKSGFPVNNTSTQQGTSESLHRDLRVQFGRWEFFPGTLPDRKVPVHVFQGSEDYLVSPLLQKSVCQRLAWVKYHEMAGIGHFLDFTPGVLEQVLNLLFEQKV